MPINQHFDAAQLSKAYENFKKVTWIFTDHKELALVAATVAVVLTAHFDLVPNDEGLANAKIKPGAFEEALGRIRLGAVGREDLEVIRAVDFIGRVRGGSLAISASTVMEYLGGSESADKQAAASLLAADLNKAPLLPWHLEEVEAALLALRILESHRHSSVKAESRHTLSLNESEFQQDVIRTVESGLPVRTLLDKEQIAEAGRIDLVFDPQDGVHRRVAIELKAEAADFLSIVDARIAQAFHYAADPRYSRVAVLYCRFQSDQPTRPAACIQVRVAGDDKFPLVVICVGQQVTTKTASRQRMREDRVPRRKTERRKKAIEDTTR